MPKNLLQCELYILNILHGNTMISGSCAYRKQKNKKNKTQNEKWE